MRSVDPAQRVQVERRREEEGRFCRHADVTFFDRFFRLLVDQRG